MLWCNSIIFTLLLCHDVLCMPRLSVCVCVLSLSLPLSFSPPPSLSLSLTQARKANNLTVPCACCWIWRRTQVKMWVPVPVRPLEPMGQVSVATGKRARVCTAQGSKMSCLNKRGSSLHHRRRGPRQTAENACLWTREVTFKFNTSTFTSCHSVETVWSTDTAVWSTDTAVWSTDTAVTERKEMEIDSKHFIFFIF